MPHVSCQIINTEEEIAREDELELEDLRKQGIAPLPKPPPGVGLLPTPGQMSPTDGSGKKIPSLFEIKVLPTVNLAQKIAHRYQINLRLHTTTILCRSRWYPVLFQLPIPENLWLVICALGDIWAWARLGLLVCVCVCVLCILYQC